MNAAAWEACAAAGAAFAGRALVQGTLVVAAAWLLCRLLRGAPARLRVWVWRIAALKFVAIALLPARLDPALPLPDAARGWLAGAPGSAGGLSSAGEGGSAASSDHRGPVGAAASGERGAAAGAFAWRLLILGGCAVAGIRLLRLCVGALALQRLLRKAAPIEDPSLRETLRSESARLGLRNPPQLRAVAGAGSPFVAGWLRSTVVIPQETLLLLTSAERRLVCGHEAAHVRNHDPLWNLVGAAVRAAFFFHPAARFLDAELRLAQELAADEAALIHQRWRPADYARTLVSIWSRCGARRERFATLAEAAGSASALTRRLETMKDHPMYGGARRFCVMQRSAAALAAAAACLTLVPWRLAAEEAKPAPAAKTEAVRLATIVLTEKKKNGPKRTLAAPKVAYAGKGPAVVEIEDAAQRIEFSIQSDLSVDPPQNVVKFKLIRDPKTPHEEVLQAPTITLFDDQEGGFRLASEGPLPADEESLEMKVQVHVLDPKEVEAAPAAK